MTNFETQKMFDIHKPKLHACFLIQLYLVCSYIFHTFQISHSDNRLKHHIQVYVVDSWIFVVLEKDHSFQWSFCMRHYFDKKNEKD